MRKKNGVKMKEKKWGKNEEKKWGKNEKKNNDYIYIIYIHANVLIFGVTITMFWPLYHLAFFR